MLKNPVLFGLFVLTFTLVSAGEAISQSTSKAASPDRNARKQYSNLEQFLRDNEELRRFYQCNFTGRFIEIPDHIKQALEKSFPDFRFVIAEMELYTDLPAKRTKLIVVSNKASEEVVAFLWEAQWGMPSRSFENLLQGQRVDSLEEASKKVIALANLFASTGPFKLGEKSISKKRIEVALLISESNTVFRTVRLDLLHKFELGKLTIRRQDGKSIKGTI